MPAPDLFYYSRTVPLKVANLNTLQTKLHTAAQALPGNIFTGSPLVMSATVPKDAPFVLRFAPPDFDPADLRPKYTHKGDTSSLPVGITLFDTDDFKKVKANTPMVAGIPDQVPVRHRASRRKLASQDFSFPKLMTTAKFAAFPGGKVLVYAHSLPRFFDDIADVRMPVAIVDNVVTLPVA